jgi:hypothetical protein
MNETFGAIIFISLYHLDLFFFLLPQWFFTTILTDLKITCVKHCCRENGLIALNQPNS